MVIWRSFICVLLWSLANRLVKYTGYGNAAGLLMTHGLLGGGPSVGEANYSSDESEGSDTEEYCKVQHKLVRRGARISAV